MKRKIFGSMVLLSVITVLLATAAFSALLFQQLEKDMERWTPQESQEEFVMRLQQLPEVQCYRLTGGPFLTYFVPTINCVTITNSILAKTELGSALMPGIRMPPRP